MSLSKFRIGIRGALVILILVFALVSIPQSSVQSQNSVVPRNPDDPTQTPLETVLSAAQQDAAVSALMVPMDSIGKSLGMDDPKNEWTRRNEKPDNVKKEGGVYKYRLAQVYQGIPVRRGNLTVRMAEGASSPDLTSAHIDYIDDPQVNTTPTLSKQRAMAIGRDLARIYVTELGGADRADPIRGEQPDPNLAVTGAAGDTADLEVHPGAGVGQRKLTWRVRTTQQARRGPVQLEAWVDQEENVVEHYNNAQTYNIGGTGNTLYQCGQYITVDFTPSVYVLNDNSLLIGTYDNYGSTSSTYQASSSSPTFGNCSTSNRNSTNADVHVGTQQTLSFMYWVLGRDFIDGARGPRYYSSVSGGTLISARNHVGINYNNAYWDGTTANFGDGNGATFGPLVSLDIVGHEWQHGLTQYTAGLIYSNESGALNEAWSDIMGSMTERYWKGQSGNTNCHLSGYCNTWKIGEQSYTPATAGDAMRYMNEPWRNGHPWHYSQRYTGTSDNGGVHSNSGIANFAFYELSTGHYLGGGIGASAATQIFHVALRDCMIPTDGFYWARQCTQYAAGVLYGFGSYNYNKTIAVWNFVGAP